MDNNTNSLTNAILKSTPDVSSPTILSTVSNTSTNNTGFFDSLQNINATTWIVIILILAFLGFNIFVYLAKGTQDITSFFGPLLQKILGTTTSVAGQAIDVSAEGAKAVVSGTAGAVNTGLTAVQNVTPNQTPTIIKSQQIQNTIQPPDQVANTALNKALNSSKTQEQNDEYHANEASSSLYAGASTGKAGWCYIGEDRGFRSCAQVGVNDKCMSGDIFPSQEICVNPNLRA
jgi:hypothetical protein